MVDYSDAPPGATGSNRTFKALREIAETIILTVIIFLLVRVAVQNFRVSGTSMMPTIKNGNLILVNKVDYLLHSPQRGDIIVFHFPKNTTEDFIKRVIGVPGDTVRIKAGQGVWVDHRKLNEPYIAHIPSYSYGPRTVPKNDYFVLGDNRNKSYDSHIWGYVPRKLIIGKALVAYWPLITKGKHGLGTNFQFFSF